VTVARTPPVGAGASVRQTQAGPKLRPGAEDEILRGWRAGDPAGRSGGARDLNGRTSL